MAVGRILSSVTGAITTAAVLTGLLLSPLSGSAADTSALSFLSPGIRTIAAEIGEDGSGDASEEIIIPVTPGGKGSSVSSGSEASSSEPTESPDEIP